MQRAVDASGVFGVIGAGRQRVDEPSRRHPGSVEQHPGGEPAVERSSRAGPKSPQPLTNPVSSRSLTGNIIQRPIQRAPSGDRREIVQNAR